MEAKFMMLSYECKSDHWPDILQFNQTKRHQPTWKVWEARNQSKIGSHNVKIVTQFGLPHYK